MQVCAPISKAPMASTNTRAPLPYGRSRLPEKYNQNRARRQGHGQRHEGTPSTQDERENQRTRHTTTFQQYPGRGGLRCGLMP